MHISIRKGLNIPLQGNPIQGKELLQLPAPSTIGLDVSPFEGMRLAPLKEVGAVVHAGEAIVCDKGNRKRVFVAPASGKIKEFIRGEKRRLLKVVIARKPEAPSLALPCVDIDSTSADVLLRVLAERGILPHIHVRPALRMPDPEALPEAIFIRALASAPFAPSPELELVGREREFSAGLQALHRLCPRHVHLVFHVSSCCAALTEAKDVVKHTASGPHPIESPSIHIEAVHPIFDRNQTIWTLDVSTVIRIGFSLSQGAFYADQVVALAGEGIAEEKRGVFRLSRGYPVAEIVKWCALDCDRVRLVSGDPLTGDVIDQVGHIGFFHSVFCALPKMQQHREMFHFLRPYRKFYTATSTYVAKRCKEKYSFQTHKRGEERAFVDPTVYNRVMPLLIPVVPLIKALLAEDYHAAEELGLLEVSPEDFALPAFICPSKVEMVAIVARGMKEYRAQHY